MSSSETKTTTSSAVEAPRRNNYYYGLRLDVDKFQAEQRYFNEMRRLGNRLTLGHGVLCGMSISADGDRICVSPGAAIDPHGREIIVPVRCCIDPWTLTDPCGQTTGTLSRDERHVVTLQVCYRECLTDYAPVLVSDCNGEEQSLPSTIVETFTLGIIEGKPEPAPSLLTKECCESLFPSSHGDGTGTGTSTFEVVDTIDVGDRPAAAAADPAGRWVVVANAGGAVPAIHAIEVATSAVRTIVDDKLMAPIGGVTIAPEGGDAFVANTHGVAQIRHTADPIEFVDSFLRQTPYGPCAAANGGALLFAVERNTGQVHVIDVAAGPSVIEVLDLGGPIVDLTVSSDGSSLFALRKDTREVRELRVDDREEVGKWSAQGDPMTTLAVVVGSDGSRRIAICGNDELLIITPAGTLSSIPLHGVLAVDSGFTTDGSRYYVVSDPGGGAPGELFVYDTDTTEQLARVPLEVQPSAVAVVPARTKAYMPNYGSGTVTVVDELEAPPDEQPSINRPRVLCRCTAGPCPRPHMDCVPLAEIELLPGGEIGRCDECRVRPRVYSNQMLYELIMCLAKRLDECCQGRMQPEPDPSVRSDRRAP